MKNRARFTGVMSALSLLPLVATHAATEKQALDACSQALAANIGELQGAPVNTRISEDSNYSKARLSTAARFYIDALDPVTSEVVARADCTVNAQAMVMNLESLPLDAEDALSRAQ